MTSPILSRLRELEAAVDAAPWIHVAVRHMQHEVLTSGDDRSDGSAPISCWHSADAELIAAMRNALPALLDRIANLEEALETAIHRWESHYEDQRTSSQPMEDAEAVELLKLCYDETWMTAPPPPSRTGSR